MKLPSDPWPGWDDGVTAAGPHCLCNAVVPAVVPTALQTQWHCSPAAWWATQSCVLNLQSRNFLVDVFVPFHGSFFSIILFHLSPTLQYQVGRFLVNTEGRRHERLYTTFLAEKMFDIPFGLAFFIIIFLRRKRNYWLFTETSKQ